MKTKHWAEDADFGWERGMRLMLWIYKKAGRLPFKIILAPVVVVAVLINRKARRGCFSFAAQIYPNASWFKRAGLVFRQFWAFSNSMVTRILILAQEFDLSKTVVHGREPLYEDLGAGKGILLVGAHHGNLEVCKSIGTRRGQRVTALVHTKHAEKYNRVLNRYAEQPVELLQVDEVGVSTAFLLQQRIEAGYIVVIAADRIPLTGDRVVTTSFLGKEAPFPQGPFLLAALLHCPVYFLFSYEQNGRFEVTFEKAYERLKLARGDREAGIKAAVDHYAKSLEQHVMKAPEQWFNFYEFWQDKRENQ